MAKEKWFNRHPWISPLERSMLLPAFAEPLEERDAEEAREDRRDRRYLNSREYRELHRGGEQA